MSFLNLVSVLMRLERVLGKWRNVLKKVRLMNGLNRKRLVLNFYRKNQILINLIINFMLDKMKDFHIPFLYKLENLPMWDIDSELISINIQIMYTHMPQRGCENSMISHFTIKIHMMLMNLLQHLQKYISEWMQMKFNIHNMFSIFMHIQNQQVVFQKS